ncbi:MAG: hypothetical protein AAGA21_02950 [Pseudomonadota bacterium]
MVQFQPALFRRTNQLLLKRLDLIPPHVLRENLIELNDGKMFWHHDNTSAN